MSTLPPLLPQLTSTMSSMATETRIYSDDHQTMPMPSPTDVSPTYDLLDHYSDEEADLTCAPNEEASPDRSFSMDEHRSMWQDINDSHDALVTQRTEENRDRVEKSLNKMRELSDAMGSASGAVGNSYSNNSVQSITDNTNTFFDQTSSLMKALTVVGQIHPFAGVAILAFQAVYELELKRRENDKKILAVYAEMRDMMAALAQLRDIKAGKEVRPDGVSIKARMEHLVEQTAEDIKHCANTCDAYLKKKLVVKMLTSGKWDAAFSKFAGRFCKRRAEFEFALSIHIGLGIDKANTKLDDLESASKQIQQRMDTMLLYFQASATPEQREMSAHIRDRGGPQVVLGNERLLKELVDLPRGTSLADGSMEVHGGRSRREVAIDIEELKLEVREDVEVVAKKNEAVFWRKFEMQQKYIMDELSRVVHREGDRIIDAVTAGPHDRIIDPDLHSIWKEMGWRGSTKARHFVLALRDYFRERMEEKKRNDSYDMSRIKKHDEWALEWINVTRLQPIVEAFDDDASNFITVTEANDLTTARPQDWSLLHWLAYWAIGWQIAATMYRDKINDLFAKMFSLKSHIHPAVRSSVDTYLHAVWSGVSELTSSIDPYYPNEALREKFQSYIDDEERRLREGLEAVRYDIDAMDTLILVTGPGRIEKYVFPVLYLLLKKDYEVMRLARKTIINKDELWDAADTIEWVFQAVDFRYKDLQDIFRQQKLDPRQQFKGFACGLFEHWRNSDSLWSRNMEFPDHIYNDEEEMQDVKADDILNYPLDSADLFDPSGYDAPLFSPTGLDARSKWPLNLVLGSWRGFLSKGDLYPYQPMMSLHIHALDSFRFEATSKTPNGTSFALTGEYKSDAYSRIRYTFTIKYDARFDPLYFCGYIYDNGYTFAGTWGATPDACAPSTNNRSSAYSTLVMDAMEDRFIFKRLPASFMCCRPDPVEFQINKPRALWKYALTTVQETVGRRLFMWTYFKRRRDNRKRYIELLIRLNYADLDEEELLELARIRQTLTTADARLYETRYDYELRTTPIHLDVTCDHCESNIIGGRIVCLDCNSTRTLNLCDDARCRDSEVSVEKRADLPAPHLPGHAVFKVRTMMHLREFGKMDQAARAALKKARTTFSDVTELLEDERSSTQSPSLRRQSRTTKIVQSTLSCIICRRRVSKPCWYCIVCKDDTFICLECDAKGPLTVGAHDKVHPLVQCQDQVHYGPLSVEQRLELFEQRFESMERHFDTVETALGTMDSRFERLESHMGAMDDKLTRIEKMLESMWVKSRKIASSRRAASVTVSPTPWSAGMTPPQSAPGYIRPLPTPGWEPADSP